MSTCAGAKGDKGEPGEKGKRGLIGFIGYKGEQGNVAEISESCLPDTGFRCSSEFHGFLFQFSIYILFLQS